MELTLNLGGPPCKELSSSIDDTSSLVQPDRRMRKHTKSRRACANCRLRRVKCDETKPGCQKCETFGVVCTYDRGDEKLQVLVKGMLAPEELKIQLPPSSESQMILNIINAPRDMPRATSMSMLLDTVNLDPIDHFSLKDLELLKNWHSKTMPTLAAADWKHVYENAYTKLTFSHPFLFHVVLTVTLMHERYLNRLSGNLETTMLYHWGRAAGLMNQKLRYGLALDERDALWASSGMLACLAFASFDARTPSEAWPLAPSTPNDFDWMKFCCGKRVIWKLTDPLRKDSVFSPLATDFTKMHVAPILDLTAQDTDMARLIEVCDINATSTPENNLYFGAVSVLAKLRYIECNNKTMSSFLAFFGCMHIDFRLLLEQKDPCAMLILAFWYAKVSYSKQWWLCRRATIECQGICMFLTWHYAHNDRILRLVQNVKIIYDGQKEEADSKQYREWSDSRISVMQVLQGVPDFT